MQIDTFYGTSAAAPGTAALVAVMKSKYGDLLNPVSFKRALESGRATVDTEVRGWAASFT
jgi:subtilase family serine protease